LERLESRVAPLPHPPPPPLPPSTPPSAIPSLAQVTPHPSPISEMLSRHDLWLLALRRTHRVMEGGGGMGPVSSAVTKGRRGHGSLLISPKRIKTLSMITSIRVGVGGRGTDAALLSTAPLPLLAAAAGDGRAAMVAKVQARVSNHIWATLLIVQSIQCMFFPVAYANACFSGT
jgi:hypothetical protein